jgi:hypothetical protein
MIVREHASFSKFGLILVLLTCSSFAVAYEKIIFVTSIGRNGNLGSWPEAGGATGIAAADAICQAQATAAGLANPSTFIAWISDSSDDAYCRAHGLTGKKASNCGEASLPAWAGPWLRTDGFPIGETIEHLLWPEVQTYVPINLDENGDPVPHLFPYYFTNTDGNGEFRDQFTGCADWTSSDAIAVRAGSATETAIAWTDSVTSFCNRDLALLCMQPGAGDPVPPFQSHGARAFVTSVSGTGNLGAWPEAGGHVGTAAGDAICQSLAAAAGLGVPETYMAWLSTPSENAIDRFTYDGPWIRIDDVLVAASKADLTDSQLLTSVNFSESGDYFGSRGVWTGATGAGQAGGASCNEWTDDSGVYSGLTGYAYAVDERWTDGVEYECSTSVFHLYCFSQVAYLFVAGFETGHTSAWSATVP